MKYLWLANEQVAVVLLHAQLHFKSHFILILLLHVEELICWFAIKKKKKCFFKCQYLNWENGFLCWYVFWEITELL